MFEQVLVSFILAISLILLIIHNKNYISDLYSEYNPIHKTHLTYVPPLGGLVIILVFYFGIYFSKNTSELLSLHVFIPAVLIFSVGLIDDLFGKASARLRFFVILFGAMIFLLNEPNLPIIEIPFLKQLFLTYPILKIFFYMICLTAITNGFNIIDGVNGLTSLTGICSILSLILLFSTNEYYNYLVETNFLFLSIFIFLIFNFPFGKIFLGDSGAYLIGWLLGVLVLKVFSNISFNTWDACLVLFYPSMEVIFSFVRKIIQKKSPLKPDLNHLHLKIFFKLKGKKNTGNIYNSIVTLCLFPFWTFPIILIYLSEIYRIHSLVSVVILSILYFIYYLVVPKIK